jgi:hypothetical protein
MTAIAVFTIFFGVVGILNGLFLVLGFLTFTYYMFQLGAAVSEIPIGRLAFPLLVVATGIVGVVVGVGILKLRPWARALSLVYGGLLVVSCAGSFVAVPIIAGIGTYDLGSIDAYGLARLIMFSVTYLVIPVPYSIVLYAVFHRPAWKATFADDPAT